MLPASAAATAFSVARSHASRPCGRSASRPPAARSTTASPERKPSRGSPSARVNVPNPWITGSPAPSARRRARRTSSCRPRRAALGAHARARRRRLRGRPSGAPPASARQSPSSAFSSSNAHAARTFRKPCRSSVASGWCRPAVALNGTPASRQTGRKRPSSARERDLGAAAAHLRTQAALGQLGHPLLQLVVERQFDVRLARKALETRRPARLDSLGTRIPAVRPVDEHRQRPVLALELVEARGRPDESREQPRVLVGAGAAILVERVRHRQARRWEERRVIDQRREGRAARVAHPPPQRLCGGVAQQARSRRRDRQPEAGPVDPRTRAGGAACR